MRASWPFEDNNFTDILATEIKNLNECGASLPILPPGWQYRFEFDPLDFNCDDNDDVVLTMRAIPKQIHYFEED